MIRIAKGFEMNILAFDAFVDKKLEKKYGFRYAESFDEILRNSDIITFHVPLIPQTHHMISMKNIKKIKKGALIINTSRGGVIDTNALSYGLQNGIISSAGLDVLEGEELIKEEKEILTNTFPREKLVLLVKDLVILKEKNVIYTPHIAFNSNEAVRRILNTTVENIENFSKNKTINNIAK